MKSNVGVIDKTVFILSIIAQSNVSTINDIVNATSIPKSTVHRILSALEAHQFVARNDYGYHLGGKFVGLVEQSSYYHLIDLSKPFLIELRNITKESSQLYVKEGNERICIASIEPTSGLKNTVSVGSVFPLNLGSAGKVLTQYQIFDPKTEIGWIESVSEREAGVASVSAPIFDSKGNLVAAVSLSGPISRMGNHPGNDFGAHVVAAALKITTSLKEEK